MSIEHVTNNFLQAILGIEEMYKDVITELLSTFGNPPGEATDAWVRELNGDLMAKLINETPDGEDHIDELESWVYDNVANGFGPEKQIALNIYLMGIESVCKNIKKEKS